jgi:3'-phosphoadenosine 5'-phosphosulfate sulfotransferase (PAPS reductase)/FAD synthetase
MGRLKGGAMSGDDLFALTDEDRERLTDGPPVVVSLSGGKDSAAAALLLERNGVPFNCIFLDTGWEHPAVYSYIDDVLEPRFGRIERLKSAAYPGGMSDLVRKKGAFAKRMLRFCTEELKWRPLKAYFDSWDDEPPVNVVGIRRGESRARSQMQRWEFDKALDVLVWRPLVDHLFEDVIAMHHEAGLRPNPLYLDGASRVGCFPCIFARKREVATVARLWPQRIDEIRALEAELTDAYRRRVGANDSARAALTAKAEDRVAFSLACTAAGPIAWASWKNGALTDDQRAAADAAQAELQSGRHAAAVRREVEALTRRTFFHGRSDTDGSIDEIVAWAQTDRGGRQFPLFDVTAQDGCMRWGLCDTVDESDLVVIDEPE